MAGNGKINHGKGMFGATALTFPFQNTKLVKGHGDGQEKGNSNYGEICWIISFKSRGSKSPFTLWGTIRSERATANRKTLLSAIKSYEVVFHRYNFLHLTGVRVNYSGVGSAIHFYEKCLASRLTEDDRDIVANPVQKIYAVFSKMYMDEKYSLIEKMDKSFGGKKIHFSGEIEKLLER